MELTPEPVKRPMTGDNDSASTKNSIDDGEQGETASQTADANTSLTASGINDLMNDSVDAQMQYLLAERSKAVNEIEMRIQFQDNWFHIKFLVVGALFAAFWVKVKITPERGGVDRSFDIHAAFYSDVTGITLALAIVIALIIDAHIRTEVLVVNQLGTWIAEYVDPALASVTRLESSNFAFRPWEQFLRNDKAMHTDRLYSYTFWVHLHAVTWLLYILYCAWRAHWTMSYTSRSPHKWPYFSDALIHLSLCAFAWASHAVPGTFTLKPWILCCQPPMPGFWAPMIFSGGALAIWICFALGTDSMATLLKVMRQAPVDA